MAGSPTGAVVIATRNRPGDLLRCLTAIHAQSEAPAEVIVVDDGSEPEVDPAALEGPVPVRVLRAGGSGPARARNIGVHAAGADVVVFTDDDTVPAPEWFAAALRRLDAHPEEVGVEGPVRSPRYDPLHAYSVEAEGPGHHWTCNIAYRRAVLERLGGFAEDAFPYAHCEDRDLACRAMQLGPIGFAGAMAVVHTPRETGVVDFIRRGRWVASELELARRHPDLIPRTRLPVRLPRSLDLSVGHARNWQRQWRAQRHDLIHHPRRLIRFTVIAIGQSAVLTATALSTELKARRSNRVTS